MSELTELLGIDANDPTTRLARSMALADRRFLGRLVELRQRRFTQQQMADVMGVSQSAVAKFERGTRDPRLSTIRRYALALGVTVQHTVDGEQCGETRDEAARRGVVGIESYLRFARSTDSDAEWAPVYVPRNLTFETSTGSVRVGS